MIDVRTVEEYLEPLIRTVPFEHHVDMRYRAGTPVHIVELTGVHGQYLFDLHPTHAISADVNLLIYTPSREAHLAGELVKIHEELCLALGIERIIIGIDENESFWNHHGYTPPDTRSLDTYRRLADERRIDLTEDTPPLHKLL